MLEHNDLVYFVFYAVIVYNINKYIVKRNAGVLLQGFVLPLWVVRFCVSLFPNIYEKNIGGLFSFFSFSFLFGIVQYFYSPSPSPSLLYIIFIDFYDIYRYFFYY